MIKNNKEIYLSKNPKKLKWLIYRNISIVDLAVFIAIFFLGGVWWFSNMSLYLKWILSITIWFFGFCLNIKTKGIRLMKFIWLYLIHIFSQKKIWNISSKNQNYYKTDSEYIYKVLDQTNHKKNKFVVGWTIESIPVETMSSFQETQTINQFSKLLKSFNLNGVYTFYKTDELHNLNFQIKKINTILKSKQLSKQRVRAYSNELKALQKISKDKENLSYPKIYFFVSFDNYNKLVKQISFFEKILNSVFNIQPITSFKIKELQDNIYNTTKKGVLKSTHIQTPTNKHKFLSIYKYPTKTNMFWLKDLFNIKHTEILLNIEPIDKQEALRLLNNAEQKSRLHMERAGKTSELIDISLHQNDILDTIKVIQTDTDTLKNINVLVRIDYKTNEEQQLIMNELKNIELNFGLKMSTLYFRQEIALNMFKIGQKDTLMGEFGTPFTSTEISSSYFFKNYGLNDQDGYLLGTGQIEQEIIVFNQFHRNKQKRTSSNMTILGKIGSGKSFLTKKIVKQQALNNSKIVVFDPENEYNFLVDALNGQRINFASQSNRINPLEFTHAIEEDNLSPLENHLIFLKTFYQNAFTDIPTIYLNMLVEITRNTFMKFKLNNLSFLKKAKPKDFPTFDDIYIEAKKYISKEKLEKEYKLNLLSYLKEFTIGTYSGLFNHKSNIVFKNNLISFELRNIFKNSSKSIATLSLYVIFSYVENWVILNRVNNEKNKRADKIMIVIDEAHLIADSNPTIVGYLGKLAKRIRKYMGSVVIATQDLKDFVGTKENAKHTEALFNNSQYLFIGLMEAGNINDLKQLFKNDNSLNDQIIHSISNAEKGDFYFKISSQKHHLIHVLPTPDELEWFRTE